MRKITASTLVKPMALPQFLRQSFPGLPQKILQNALDRRDVKRDGQRLGEKDLVAPGDELTVFIDDRYLDNADCPQIVYEDNHILVAVKEPGISVTEDKNGAETLQDRIRRHYPAAVACHRLDYHTGGMVVFALNPKAQQALEAAFRDRTVEKYYRCLVFGRPDPGKAHLKGYLIKDAENALVRVYPREIPGSLPIETAYETLDTCETVSLLRVELITGRTHQIRAHLAAIGHPICGDDRYGDRAKNKEFRVTRQQLWATELYFHFDKGPFAYLNEKPLRIKPRFTMRGFE